MKKGSRTLILVLCWLFVLTEPTRADISSQRASRGSQQITLTRVNRSEKNKSLDQDQKQNEIEGAASSSAQLDKPYLLPEPYKSLVQTTARYALAQTGVPNHINIDTAMSMLNDAAYLLFKPGNLLRAVKVASVLLASSLGLSIFVPGGSKFVESLWRDPASSLDLDSYLTNGVSERSVLDVVSSKTDEAFNRVGIEAQICREKSLCHIGEILRCFFPTSSQSILKFSRENFSSNSEKLRELPLAQAFLSGFVDRNCTKLVNQASQAQLLTISSRSGGSTPNSSCFGNFLTSIFGSTKVEEKPIKEMIN